MQTASPPPTDAEERDALHCPQCGYNLTGLTEHRCPECGAGFSPAILAAMQRAGVLSVSWIVAQMLVIPALIVLVYPWLCCLPMMVANPSPSMGHVVLQLVVLLTPPLVILGWHSFQLADAVQRRQRLLHGDGHFSGRWSIKVYWSLLFTAETGLAVIYFLGLCILLWSMLRY